MTTKPNTNNTSDYANNYFYIDRRDEWQHFVWNAILKLEVFSFDYKGKRVSMRVPPREDVPDYRALMNAMNQRLVELGLKRTF